jgi:hypothetical protein
VKKHGAHQWGSTGDTTSVLVRQKDTRSVDSEASRATLSTARDLASLTIEPA